MGKVKQINIKNQTYYFYNDINIKDFDARLLQIDKDRTKTLVFTTLGISQKIDDYQNIYSVNPSYLVVTNASGYIEKEDLNTLHIKSS